ncbi:hypothetical protein B484DRAFT_455419, partial [Ochromonadaceae sp. CCMP2298]
MTDFNSLGLGGLVNFGPAPIDNTQNKRIHVKFMNRMVGCATEQARMILNRVWTKFGRVVKIHYPESWSYCFLSFGSHGEAEAAMNELNDQGRFTTTAKLVLQQVQAQLALEIISASNNQLLLEAASQKIKTFKRVANLLGFPASRFPLSAIRASWASPSSNNQNSHHY